jgi:hypothetical protein
MFMGMIVGGYVAGWVGEYVGFGLMAVTGRVKTGHYGVRCSMTYDV